MSQDPMMKGDNSKKIQTSEKRKLKRQSPVIKEDYEDDDDDDKDDVEDFQQWWSTMVANRQRLRKKKTHHVNVSLADRIMLKRKGKEKDELPLGTSASDLHTEELKNRQHRIHSLSPKSDRRHSGGSRRVAHSSGDELEKTRKYSERRRISQQQPSKHSVDSKSEATGSSGKSDQYYLQQSEKKQKHANKTVITHTKINHVESVNDSSTSDYSTSTETDEETDESRSEDSDSQEIKTNSRDDRLGKANTVTLIHGSTHQDQYVQCENGKLSKHKVIEQTDMQMLQGKYNTDNSNSVEKNKAKRISHMVVKNSVIDDKSKQVITRKNQSTKYSPSKSKCIEDSFKVESASNSSYISDLKPEMTDGKSEKEQIQNTKGYINNGYKDHSDSDYSGKSKDKQLTKKESMDRDLVQSAGITDSSINQSSLPPSHPSKRHVHKKQHKRDTLDKRSKKNNKREKQQKESSISQSYDDSARESSHISSLSLASSSTTNGANSVLPHQSNLVSWDSDEEPDTARVTTLPKINRKQSSKPKLKDKSISSEGTKFPSIDNSDRPRLISQKTDSRESDNSPWAEKTSIPDHLKHLSNDYAPVRVSSLPGSNTHPRGNMDTSRRHSSPNTREPKRRNTTSPYVSNKFKQAKIDLDIAKMERKLDKDLNEIINKFRDKSVDHSGGW